MSRGPGMWQRGILAAVEHYGMVWIRDLLPHHARKSERNALERAAWLLVRSGRIEMRVFRFGRQRLLATRPNWPVQGRPPDATHRPVSVGETPIAHSTHTYENAPDILWPAWRHTRYTASDLKAVS